MHYRLNKKTVYFISLIHQLQESGDTYNKISPLEVCFNVSFKLVPSIKGPVTVFITAFVRPDSIMAKEMNLQKK